MNLIVIIVVVLILLLLLRNNGGWHTMSSIQTGGEMPFSYVQDAYKTTANLYRYKGPSLWNTKLTNYPHAAVYQGQSIPLKYEDRLTLPPENPMYLIHNRFRVSPDCCPSMYTTDQGCICWKPKYNPKKGRYTRRFPIRNYPS